MKNLSETIQEKPAPASQVHYEMALRKIAYYKLSKYPEFQAEAIAKHYVAHAMIALQLLKLTENRRHDESAQDLEYLIKMLVDQIKTNHLHDFGIELDWPTLKP